MVSKKMHMVSAHIELAGSRNSVTVRHADRPLSYPELEVLRVMHGPMSVQNVVVVSTIETTPAFEKDRLSAIYGEELVNDVFPGRNPHMDLLDPDHQENPDAPKKRGRRSKKAQAADDGQSTAPAPVSTPQPPADDNPFAPQGETEVA